jgi:hypothetical protein
MYFFNCGYLPNLIFLHINTESDKKLINLEGIRQCPNLQHLHVNNFGIMYDTSCISELKHLLHLHLEFFILVDFILPLTLNTLYLKHCEGEITNLEVCMQLYKISLISCKLKGNLNSCPSLREVKLRSMYTFDFTLLEGCTSLTRLKINVVLYSKLENVSLLSFLVNLTYITLSFITKEIEAILNTLPKLKHINLLLVQK